MIISLYRPLLGPGPVNLLNVTSRPSPSELQVTWQETTENNCRETRYHIQYKLLNQDQCLDIEEEHTGWTGSFYVFGTKTYATLQQLLPFSTYDVSVSAVNDEGQGVLSSITQRTNMSRKQHFFFRN